MLYDDPEEFERRIRLLGGSRSPTVCRRRAAEDSDVRCRLSAGSSSHGPCDGSADPASRASASAWLADASRSNPSDPELRCPTMRGRDSAPKFFGLEDRSLSLLCLRSAPVRTLSSDIRRRRGKVIGGEDTTDEPEPDPELLGLRFPPALLACDCCEMT